MRPSGITGARSARSASRGSAAFSIEATDLRRVFRKRAGWFRSGEEIVAVKQLSFAVPRGTIFGLLGPNGAGKTTTIKLLSTLLVPTSGTATINGFDVVKHEMDVRRQLGVLFGGDRGLYLQLSGLENLRYFGRLYGMTDEAIGRRAAELLAAVDLLDRADERVESWSRGMRQRLHIAKTLLHQPSVLILDEPTIGLDPGAALDIRRLIARLVPEQTILLTTHDMHEAEELCAEIAIIDHGEIVAQGTPARLKALAAVERQVVIHLAEPPAVGLRAVEGRLQASPAVHHARHVVTGTGVPMFMLRCDDTSAALNEALAVLHAASAQVTTIQVREPSLEDAFLAATGREYEEVPV